MLEGYLQAIIHVISAYKNLHIILTTPHSKVSVRRAPSSRCTYVLVLAQQQVLEGVFEGDVAQGVAGRVDGAVDVAEPVADGPQGVRDADGAEGVDQDHHVVGRPCNDESNQDGHDSARHLFLPRRNALPFPLCYSRLLCYLVKSEGWERKKCNYCL